MKGDIALLGSMAVSMVAIPLAALLWAGALGTPPFASRDQGPQTSSAAAATAGEDETGEEASSRKDAEEKLTAEIEEMEPYSSPVRELKVLDRSTGRVETLSLEEYVRGAIAAEMPATFHEEALKAQGVAALSYALNLAIAQRESPDPALKGADFSADPGRRQGYMTEEQAREFYGDTADYNWDKICRAAEEACQVVATYEGEPIAAAYHAISSGVTENAANIWEGPVPYLVEADSSWDMLAEGYKSMVSFTQAEMEEKLTAAGATLGPDFTSWLEILERSPAGYVTSIRAGDLTLHGNELRNLLGLRSACFYLSTQTRGFIFEVRGYGHGAGLSQNGADYLARQGKNFCQILRHYYTGVQLCRLEV